jgi:branched-chain amino acid transport system substrate-binding protein
MSIKYGGVWFAMKMTRANKLRAIAMTAILALLLAGCGNRLPYGQVLAANAQTGGSSGASSLGSGGANSIGGSKSTSAGKSGGISSGQSGSSASSNSSGSSQGSTGSAGGGAGAGAGAGPSGAATSNGPATLSTVNIGQLGTNNGIMGTLLAADTVGVKIWASYVNQHGGLGGHKVNLITADDNGDPSTALSEAKTMVEQDHVIAFLSNADLLTTPTIAPYLQQMGVPAIGGTLTESEWTTNPDFYPQGATLRPLVDGSMNIGIQKGDKNVGVIACVEFALICSSVANIIQRDGPALGGKVVYNASVSLAQPDFTSQCLSAKSAGVNNFWLAMDPNSDLRLANDCAAQNYHPIYNTLVLAFTPLLLTSPNAVGMVAAGSVFPFMEVTPATAQFDQAVQQSTGGPPTTEFEASAWVSGLILQQASINLPVANPRPADVVAGLDQIKNNNFGGLTDSLTYTNGQPTQSPSCFFVAGVVQGGFNAPYGMTPQCLPTNFAAEGP